MFVFMCSTSHKLLKPVIFKHVLKAMSTQVIKEGKAEIQLLSDNVFYNPVQEFNRDLSIAVLRTFINELINSDQTVSESNLNS